MSTKNTLSDSDQRLLRLLAAIENDLAPKIGSDELARLGSTVEDLEQLAAQARHARLLLRARDLVALLSPNPTFAQDLRGTTTSDPAFLVPLASAARSSAAVSGAPLGVWAGAQRPAMGSAAWTHAERELRDLVGVIAPAVVPASRQGPLVVPYQPLARPSHLTEVTRTDLPGVVIKPVPQELRAAADEAASRLEAYVRTLESFDELSYGIRAARLPPALFDLWMREPEGVRLVERIETIRHEKSLSMQGLLTRLVPDVTAPDRRHILAISELLQRFDVGFEPDPRFLAPLAHPTTELSFFDWRLPGDKPSGEFITASAILHIGLAMAGADGHVDPAEVEHVRERAMGVVSHDDERTRLTLRMQALALEPPDFDRLLLRLKSLKPAAKEIIADLLVSVASTDGDISSVEYDALQRAYRAMRLGTPALDRVLEELRGEVRLSDAVGAGKDRRSQLGRDLDAKRFDALRELLVGTSAPATD